MLHCLSGNGVHFWCPAFAQPLYFSLPSTSPIIITINQTLFPLSLQLWGITAKDLEEGKAKGCSVRGSLWLRNQVRQNPSPPTPPHILRKQWRDTNRPSQIIVLEKASESYIFSLLWCEVHSDGAQPLSHIPKQLKGNLDSSEKAVWLQLYWNQNTAELNPNPNPLPSLALTLQWSTWWGFLFSQWSPWGRTMWHQGVAWLQHLLLHVQLWTITSSFALRSMINSGWWIVNLCPLCWRLGHTHRQMHELRVQCWRNSNGCLVELNSRDFRGTEGHSKLTLGLMAKENSLEHMAMNWVF